MNYRHAFHAGNHTEVFKHAVLTMLLEHLLEKSTPFAVVDTHAGIGAYDLCSEEAVRTNERLAGVDKVFGKSLESAPMYGQTLQALNGDELQIYPGSPELARRALREGDRLLLCELHPEDSVMLKARYHREHRVSVHHRDGYEAVGALLPPREKRGLVFIDPPFELRDETDKLATALTKGFRRWSTGIYAVWYPIKRGLIGDRIAQAARNAGFSSILRTEFCPFERDSLSLAGSGMVICNPPWKIEDRIKSLCKELAPLLGGSQTTWSVDPVPAQT